MLLQIATMLREIVQTINRTVKALANRPMHTSVMRADKARDRANRQEAISRADSTKQRQHHRQATINTHSISSQETLTAVDRLKHTSKADRHIHREALVGALVATSNGSHNVVAFKANVVVTNPNSRLVVATNGSAQILISNNRDSTTIDQTRLPGHQHRATEAVIVANNRLIDGIYIKSDSYFTTKKNE